MRGEHLVRRLAQSNRAITVHSYHLILLANLRIHDYWERENLSYVLDGGFYSSWNPGSGAPDKSHPLSISSLGPPRITSPLPPTLSLQLHPGKLWPFFPFLVSPLGVINLMALSPAFQRL